MRKLQHSTWVVALLAVVAGSSQAEVRATAAIVKPGQVELPVDAANLPPECTQFLSLLPGSTSDTMPYYQELSIAACRQRFDTPPVTTPQQIGPMVASVEAAMAPSVAIYSDVANRSRHEVKLLAEYGLGMTYLDTVVRARRAIDAGGSMGGATYGGYKDGIVGMHRAAEPLLAHDLEMAVAAFHAVDLHAAADPHAATSDEVMVKAVATARYYHELLGR
jgi:hypothetical protein